MTPAPTSLAKATWGRWRRLLLKSSDVDVVAEHIVDDLAGLWWIVAEAAAAAAIAVAVVVAVAVEGGQGNDALGGSTTPLGLVFLYISNVNSFPQDLEKERELFLVKSCCGSNRMRQTLVPGIYLLNYLENLFLRHGDYIKCIYKNDIISRSDSSSISGLTSFYPFHSAKNNLN